PFSSSWGAGSAFGSGLLAAGAGEVAPFSELRVGRLPSAGGLGVGAEGATDGLELVGRPPKDLSPSGAGAAGFCLGAATGPGCTRGCGRAARLGVALCGPASGRKASTTSAAVP